MWIYLQQRSFEKADFPGYYDISSAGHIDVGEEKDKAVMREVWEETGVPMRTDALQYLGEFRKKIRVGAFCDSEICEVYLYTVPKILFQIGEEVERMIRVSYQNFSDWVCSKMDVLQGYEEKTGEYTEITTENFCVQDRAYLNWVIEHMQEKQERHCNSPENTVQ